MFNKNQQPEFVDINKKSSGIWFTVVICTCIAFLMFVIIFTSVVGLVQINQGSMMPTLNDNQFALLLNSPNRVRRGDVVTVRTPEHYRYPNRNPPINFFIKRVIATGGDTIKFRVIDNTVNINSELQPINEVIIYVKSYGSDEFILQEESHIIYEPMGNTDRFYSDINRYHTHITKDNTFFFIYEVPLYHIYILGDNRNTSVDSKRYGSFHLDSVTGRMITPLRQGGFWEWLFRVIY
ncbi:MAG: signal peptidase I [Firmicutes bacterium]|nr:signal peptidase I [Bacillota bacterium]